MHGGAVEIQSIRAAQGGWACVFWRYPDTFRTAPASPVTHVLMGKWSSIEGQENRQNEGKEDKKLDEMIEPLNVNTEALKILSFVRNIWIISK